MGFTERIAKILEALKDEKQEENSRHLEISSGKSGPRQLQRAGKALANVVVKSVRTGVFGRTILTVGANHGDSLAIVEFGQGNPIVVKGSIVSYSGYVLSTNQTTWDVCIEEDYELVKSSEIMSQSFHILQTVNDVTYKRMKMAARELEKMEQLVGTSSCEKLMRMIFCDDVQPSLPITNIDYNKLKIDAKHLNAAQQNVIMECVRHPELFCIHGPPGTGKTTTIAHVIAEFVARGMKILVTCPSNAAVDVLLERVAKMGINIRRLGHPVRTSPHLRQLTMDAKLKQNQVLDELKTEMYQAKGRERGELRKELRSREEKICKETLESADVVIATCTVVGDGSILDILKASHFNVAIVDEAGQAMEPAIYPTMVRCSSKIILAGDPCQLPPTVLSQNKRLSRSLLEDVMDRFPKNVGLLTTQYRMNQLISDWVSRSMYDELLTADNSVSTRVLSQIDRFKPTTDLCSDLANHPFTLIDTVGAQMNETSEDGNDSKSNPGEAAIVAVLVAQLIASGLEPDDLAVISPYSAQVQLINSITPRSICANSVDGFQGGEAEVVILSLVRSNTVGECGFLKDKRRLNVAVSRARRCCIVIGDTETITQIPYIDDMVTYICDAGNLIALSSVQNQPEWVEATSNAGYVEIVESTLIAEPEIEPKIEPEVKKTQVKKTVEPENKSNSVDIVVNEDVVVSEAVIEKAVTAVPKVTKVENKKKSKLERKIENALAQKDELVTAERSYKTNDFSVLSNETASTQSLTQPAVGMATCTQCQKTLPAANMELHQLHCARMMRQKAAEKPVEYVQKTPTKKKTKKKNVKSNPQNRDFDNIDNLDELLDKAVSTAGHCAYGTCKTRVLVMGFSCSTCSKVFCSLHKYPESHGCKASKGAHIAGKTEIIKKKVLQNKLADKLGDLEKTRKTKPKKK